MRKRYIAAAVLFALPALALSESNPRSDAELTARVKSAVANTVPNARDIQVETRDGVVQLSGFVESDDVQENVMRVARDVKGVTEVRNDLTLREGEDFSDSEDAAASNPADDTVIASRVRNKLDDASLSASADVNVDVEEGVVQLSGFVASTEEKTRAADVVSTVRGVKDVRNNIALANPE